jgi:DNA-binding CsgD family transcriptional regulator/tetratricopeptide (TPR) repeat protein
MQPTQQNGGHDVLPPAFAARGAREAWFAGDYDGCLRMLDSAVSASDAEQREMLLLRARALIRLRQPNEVISLLGPALSTFTGIDEVSTARMLHATAIARHQSLERGLASLLETEAAARAFNAHHAIRGEIAYEIGYAYWLLRDCERTLEYALLAEAARADIISVRAASLRAFVAILRERYPQALALFRSARRTYDSCSAKDQALVEMIVVQIATLEVALQSKDIVGTHALPMSAGTRLPIETGTNSSDEYRAVTATMDAWLYAFEGDRSNAYRMVRHAESVAPDRAWRIWVLANRAKVFAAFGDLFGAADFAEAALDLVDQVDWNKTASEARVALLHLAEILTRTAPTEAVKVFDRYEALTSEVDRSLVFRSDVRLWILEEFVRGLIFRVRGDVPGAWRALKNVYQAATRVGIIWRSAMALIELDSTPNPARPKGDHYLQAAAMLVREHFPRSFVARRLGRWVMAHEDPIAKALAPQPREVLRHLLDGKNSAEISSILGLAEGTVRNYIKVLHAAFGVHSTPQLLVACYERGIGTPAWWDSLAGNDRAVRRNRAGRDIRMHKRDRQVLDVSADAIEIVGGKPAKQVSDRVSAVFSEKPGIGHVV